MNGFLIQLTDTTNWTATKIEQLFFFRNCGGEY